MIINENPVKRNGIDDPSASSGVYFFLLIFITSKKDKINDI